MKRAELALQKDNSFEARKWAVEALETKPNYPKAQALMAQVIEREVRNEKSLAQAPDILEELNSEQKSLQIKTWLERSRGFLEINQFEEAARAVEQVFLLDPDNLEASRLIDQIKDKATKEGHEEDLFLQDLYQKEINARMIRYGQQAENLIQQKKWGEARFVVEKILMLDPKNAKGRRLSAVLDKQVKNL